MFDINEAIDNIIYKYNIDEYYPSYRKASNCEKILKKIIDNHGLANENVLFLCNDQLEIEIISHNSQGCELVECINYNQISDSIEWNRYKEVYILSYEKYDDMSEYLDGKTVNYLWVYDVFEKYGYSCCKDFYRLTSKAYESMFSDSFPGKEGWRNNIQLELYNCQKRYNNACDENVKTIELKKCLYLSLYMRNFLSAHSYFMELSKVDVKYKNASEEVDELLTEIKRRVKEKQDKNVVLYWMDAISYEECGDMPYLQQQMNESVVFENAFTSTPNTFPTGKAMFLGKYMVDDKGYQIKNISLENSEVLKLFKEQEYNIKSISGYMRWFDYEYRSEKRHELYDSCSMILWDLLNNLVNNEGKTFYIVHMLVEGHHPFLTSEMDEIGLLDDGIRYSQGRRELDKQLRFFDEFINSKSYRIYMSDHGQHQFSTRYHVILSVYGNGLMRRKINKMFSLIDFVKLIKQILEDGCIDESSYEREYVKIQDIDWYNYKHIRRLINDKIPPDMFLIGYKGVITKEKMYIKFKTGQEWVTDRNIIIHEPALWDGYYNEYSDEEQQVINIFREYAGDNITEIDNDERFKYSKYIYKLIDKYKVYMEEYMNIIYKEMDKYPSQSIAIRMGGDHSVELYARMGKEYRKKIKCFIDNNEMCKCSKFGIPIIKLDELEMNSIQGVILSSYDYLEALREEIKQYDKGINVIDIYEAFEKNGICCTKNFYMDIKMAEEDYDVGFPL